MYVVILAGGGGTRLRPLSRPELPKPFLPLLGPDSLFQLTLERLPEEVDGQRDVFVVTDRRYEEIVRRQAARVAGFGGRGIRVVAEPVGRNTAPAVALAAAAIERPAEEVMLVLPADHFIADVPLFRDVLRGVVGGLALGALGVENPLVTLGIEPTGPETVYGYIRPRCDEDGAPLTAVLEVPRPDRPSGEFIRLAAHPVEAFVEKPSRERAEQLVNEGGVYWNAGMFAWRRRAIRDAFSLTTRAAAVYQPIAQALASGSPDALALAYEEVETVSIDYAVMEPAAAAGRVLTAGMRVGWSDLGNWTALLQALGLGPQVRGRVVEVGEAVELGADDLLVLEDHDRLFVEAGPRGTMTLPSTGALLAGAGPGRAVVEDLLDRATRARAAL
jgi:mannose-1-phosphate guanylyltransferase